MADELKIRVVFDTGQANSEGRKFTEGTIGALKQQLEKAKTALLDLTKGTEAHANQLKKITQLQNDFNLALGKVPKTAGDVKPAMDRLQSGSANAAMTLQALNYTVRDSPYFFRDFSLGILAIGNNLNPLIDGLRRMNIDAKASNMTFMQMAKQTLGSGGMFTLGMSFAVTAIQALTFVLAKNKNEAEEQQKTLSDLADELKTLEERYRDAKEEMLNIPAEDTAASFRAITKAVQEQIDKLNEAIRRKQAYDKMFEVPAARPSSVAIQQSTALKGSKEATEEIKTTEKQLNLEDKKRDALLEQDRILKKIKEAYFSGDKKGVATIFGGLSKQEQDNLIKFIRDSGSTLDSTTKKSFQYANEWIELTKDRAKELADIFEKVLNPKTPKDLKVKLPKLAYEDVEELGIKLTEKQEKFFNELKESAERAGLIWTPELQAYALQIAMGEDKAGVTKQQWIDNFREKLKSLGLEHDPSANAWLLKIIATLDSSSLGLDPYLKDKDGNIKGQKTTKEGKSAEDILKDTKSIENEVKRAKEQFSFLSNIVNQVGDAIFQSFLHGKSAVDSMITSVMILIAKMLVIKGVTTLFGIGEGFNSGGIVHAAGGRIIGGVGNTDTVPAMLTPGEMVLNKNQQANLFKAINDGRFGQSENLLRTLINRIGEGFNSGGIVHAAGGRIIGGVGNTDTVPAMLTPGEMVLNKNQQANLFKAINDGRFGQSENLLRTLINRVEALNMNMLNNRPIVNIIEKTPALKFTKEVVNRNQDRLTRGNVIVGS